jgi:hypothetical protein
MRRCLASSRSLTCFQAALSRRTFTFAFAFVLELFQSSQVFLALALVGEEDFGFDELFAASHTRLIRS